MSLAVFDVDGVLADVAHRRHHLQRRDWRAFFAAAGQDPVLDRGRTLVTDAAALGVTIVYLSGRPERLRRVTLDWLATHDLPPGDLLLRPDGDQSPATRLKLRHLRTLSGREDIALFVDDDSWVVDAVRGADPPLVTGLVVLADWQSGDADGRRVLRRAQQDEGRT